MNQPSSQPVADRVLLGGALVAFTLFWLLGRLLSPHGPSGLDAAALHLVGHGGDLVAWTLTESGFFKTFETLFVLMLISALVSRNWLYLRRIIFSIVTLLGGWVVSDAWKGLFHRARGDVWLVRHETSFSYPSGHATLGVLFWVLWAYFVWNSDLPLPLRRIASCALIGFVLAVGWSRLELGAHFLSDVAGGYLLGLAWLGLMLALAHRLRVKLYPR